MTLMESSSRRFPAKFILQTGQSVSKSSAPVLPDICDFLTDHCLGYFRILIEKGSTTAATAVKIVGSHIFDVRGEGCKMLDN